MLNRVVLTPVVAIAFALILETILTRKIPQFCYINFDFALTKLLNQLNSKNQVKPLVTSPTLLLRSKCRLPRQSGYCLGDSWL